MKKRKMNNKGFTLVELIVVLVILAILAAILVPTLMGYIDKAREEKDFSTAQAVRVATQSMIAEMYGKSESITEGANGTVVGKNDAILKLVGADSNNKVDGKSVALKDVSIDSNNQITKIVVTIDGSDYTYENGKWTAAKAQQQQQQQQPQNP